jgi:hypothetical protein
MSFSGSASGTRYTVDSNAVIYTAGGIALGKQCAVALELRRVSLDLGDGLDRGLDIGTGGVHGARGQERHDDDSKKAVHCEDLEGLIVSADFEWGTARKSDVRTQPSGKSVAIAQVTPRSVRLVVHRRGGVSYWVGEIMLTSLLGSRRKKRASQHVGRRSHGR